MKPISRQTANSIIAILFVAAGSLALLYQIVWFKYLSFFLGNTIYAQVVAFAAFMGGLAIGSAWWGRKADRASQPLRLYALIEVGIGLYCLLSPTIFDFFKSIFISVASSSGLSTDGTMSLLLKFIISACLLLVPTVLIGGTLPIIIKFISKKMEESGKDIAMLFFLNIFGIIVGLLLTGFFLIRILGLSTVIYSAGIINIFIGSYVLLLSIYGIPSKISATGKANKLKKTKKAESSFYRREIFLAIITAGVSGLAAMIYEIAWIRLLIPVIGSSVYSLLLMIVAFISGVAIGSYIVSVFIQRIKKITSLLAWCQIGMALSMLVTLPLYGRIPYEFWRVTSVLNPSELTFPIYLIIQFFFCLALMIIPAIFLGMLIPAAIRKASSSLNVLGRTVGNVLAVNILGIIAGSLMAGLMLIPTIGIKHTFEVGIACNLLVGVSILLFVIIISRQRLFAIISVIIVILIMYLIIVPDWNNGAMLFSVPRKINSKIKLPANYQLFENIVSRSDSVLYYKEGASATVGVIDNGAERSLIVNGNPEVSSKSDLNSELLCGQIPCLIKANPQNVLVIGFGDGVTVGSILTHPINRVDCIEILPEVVEASHLFDNVNHSPLSDTRTKLYIEDPREFLKLTHCEYNIIISELKYPWIEGTGDLITTDFFDLCKQHLSPDGCMVQWFHLYGMDDRLFKMIVQTFQASFKNVSIWQPVKSDVIIVGSNQDQTIDYKNIQAMLSVKKVNEDLGRIGINDAAALLSLEALSPRAVLNYIDKEEQNTENRPQLEYDAQKTFFLNGNVSKLLQLDERMGCDSADISLKMFLKDQKLTDEELRNIGFYHTNSINNNLRFGYSALYQLQTKYNKDVVLLERLARVAGQLNLPEEALTYRKRLIDLQPKNPAALEKYAWLKYSLMLQHATLLTPIDIHECETLLRKSISIVSDTVDLYRIRLADVFYGTQQYSKAMDQYARALQIRAKYESDPNFHDNVLYLQLARCLDKVGQSNRAFGYALQAVSMDPLNEEAREFIYSIWNKNVTPAKQK